MKVGALIVGIFGGLVSLFYGFMGNMLGAANGSAGIQIISIALPIIALVGAGMVMAKPMIGAALMGVVAVAFLFILGFNVVSLVPIVLLGVGAALGFMGAQSEVRAASA